MRQIKAHALFAYAVFTAIVCSYAMMAVWFPIAYIWGTYEDLFGEWTQFWLLVAGLVCSMRIVFSKGAYRPFFGILAVSFFYVAMEEISWGQRVIGFESPDYFKAKNLQGETNLHNFLTGPYSTVLKDSLGYLLAAGLVIYGLVVPVALRARWRIAVWADKCGLAVPPAYLWPFFVLGAVLELGPFGFNEAEVAEILIAYALASTALHYGYARKRGLDASASGTWAAGESGRLALRAGLTTVLVLLLAGGTTLAIYATPEGKKRSDTRIKNGVDKFAGRYARYERWDMAAALYERVLLEKPDSASTLRKLAKTYRNAGDLERYDARIATVLQLDLDRYEKDPSAASVNRSLVRTYRMMGETAKAEAYMRRALRIGLERVEKHPNGANAAYSLGRTYELMGQHEKALEHFERANRLKPTSKKFKKAYLKAALRSK